MNTKMRPATGSRFGVGEGEVDGDGGAGEAGEQFLHESFERLQGTLDRLDGPQAKSQARSVRVSAEATHRPLVSCKRTSTQNAEQVSWNRITDEVSRIRLACNPCIRAAAGIRT